MSALPSLDFLRLLGGAVVVADATGAVLHWSSGSEQLLGFSAEEMKNWWEAFPLATRTQIQTAISTRQAPGSFIGACLIKNRQGGLVPIAVSITPLSEDVSVPNAWLTICHKLPEKLSGAIMNPSDIARAEREPGPERAEWVFHNRKAQAIGALAGGITHDFNNLLTSVFAHLDLLVSAPGLPEDLLTHATRSRTSATRAAELVSRLLVFSRLTRPVFSRVEVPALLDDAILALRRSVDASIQVLPATSAPDVWAVHGDASHLTLAVSNLCLSGRDAMPKGGTLSLEAANAELAEGDTKPPQRAGEFVRFTVSETGKGMATEVFARLAGACFTGKEFGKGPALGLSIAHSIVTEHGGWMEVEAELGQGSRFHAYLPRCGA